MGYKVGDKIKIREWDDMEKEFGLDIDCDIDTSPCFTKEMKKYCGKTLEITEITCAGTYKVKGGNYYIFSNDMIVKEDKMKEWKMRIKTQEELNMVVDELIKQRIKWYSGRMVNASDKELELPVHFYYWQSMSEIAPSLTYGYDLVYFKDKELLEITPQEFCKAHKETIVIYRDGNSVIAMDKVTGKKAVAKCHPDDEFDFMVGAKLALERLSQPDEPKYYNGKVVCVKSATASLTVGKIYNVENGQFKDDKGYCLPIAKKLKSFSDFDNRFSSKFIEIVE